MAAGASGKILGPIVALSLGILGSALPPREAAAVSSTVVISQVFGAGGLGGAVWQNDYVVLFNNGTAPVNVTGWALQFRPPAGGTWSRVNLSGTIGHGHYYLVQLAQGGPSGAPLPPADVFGAVDLDPVDGAIALTSNQNPIVTSCASEPDVVDLVGYGGSPCFETAPAPATNPFVTISREPACLDTDNNAFDYQLVPASPRNSDDTNACNNQAPVLQPIADLTILEGSVHNLLPSADDPDGDPLTYGGTGPGWLSINPLSGECTLAPDLAAAETNGGDYPVTLTASDGLNSSDVSFTIHVTDFTSAANIPYSGTWPGGVNSHTRELWFDLPEDIRLGGPFPPRFSRYYASVLDREGYATGHLGTNWLGEYDTKLVHVGSEVTVVDGRGERLVFGEITGGWAPLDHLDEGNRLVIRGVDNMHRLYRPRLHRMFEYDGTDGLLRKIIDERGNSLDCTYTGSLLTEVTDGHGRTLSFTYDGADRLTSVSDGTRTVGYGYTGTLLTSFTDAMGHTTTYGYAISAIPGLLTSVTEPLGNTPRSWTYDSDGNVSSSTDAFGHTWTYGVGPGGGCDMTQPGGGVWTATHDAGLRLQTLVDPDDGLTLWTYDPIGRPTSVTRPLGDVTTLAYDPASGFPSDLGLANGTSVHTNYLVVKVDGVDIFDAQNVTYPDGTGESYTYDAEGNRVTRTDRAGESWSATYNANGQPLTLTNPSSGVTTFTYDSQLRLASLTDNSGNTTTYAYDALDRMVTLTHPDTDTRSFTYDADDFLVGWVDEAGEAWARSLDANGRITSRTDPLGHVVQYAYDAMDRLVSATDALNHTAGRAYDALGRPASSTDRTGRTTSYAYDALNRLVTRTDPGSNATTFAYDGNGRLVSMTDPLGHARTYQYDALDYRTRATDALGNAVQYVYDSMGRLASANAPLGHTEAFGYDPRGLMTSFFDVTSETQLPRDPLGAVSSIRDPNLKIWPLIHDPQGRRTSQEDPLGRATTFGYDNRGRLSNMTTPVGSVNSTYDPVGNGVECQWLDGVQDVTLTYTRDAARRLTGATGMTFAYDDADRMVSGNGLTFTRDDEGRLTGETYAPGKSVTYVYDARGLLSQVTDWIGGSMSFSYDAAGRLTSTTRPNGVTATYQYDDADRLIEKVELPPGPPGTPISSISLIRDALGRTTNATRVVPLPAGPTVAESTGYAYDDAGQIVGMTFDGLGRLLGDGSRSFTYDAAGRLSGYAAGAENPTFTHDALGRILSRDDGALHVEMVWDYATTTPSLATVDPGPSQVSYFVHTPDGMPLWRIDEAGVRTFYHFDETGNVTFLTNESAAVVTSYAYSRTGMSNSIGDTPDNPYTYRGAVGAIRVGGGLYHHYGLLGHHSRCYDEKTVRCASCPAEPHTGEAAAGGSGLAELEGNDGIVDLGGSGFDDVSLAFSAADRRHRREAGTLLHELGHDIGLPHRGAQPGPIQASVIPWLDVTEPDGGVISALDTRVLWGPIRFDGPGGGPTVCVVGCYEDDFKDAATTSTFGCLRDDFADAGTPSVFRFAGECGHFVLSDDCLNQLFASLSRYPEPFQRPTAFVLSEDVLNQMFWSFESQGPLTVPADDWNWITHVDRQLASPLELLHVSGHRPDEIARHYREPVVFPPIVLSKQGACHGWRGDDCASPVSPKRAWVFCLP